MTERKKRVRVAVKPIVTDELLDLFRKAWPADRELSNAIMARRELPREKHFALIEAVRVFNIAAGTPLWERFGPLHPRATGDMGALQDALVAKLTGPELKAWG